MPCIGPTDAEMKSYEAARAKMRKVIHNLAEFEAVLCGILTAHGVKVLDAVDFEEVGVSRRFVTNWWKDHQEKDAARRAEEEAAERFEVERQEVLDKLTDRERRILFGK